MALLGQLNSASSYDDVGEAIVREAVRRGYSRAEQIAVTADAIQESGLTPGITSPNGLWIGIYQQDSGYTDRRNPNANIQQFMDRLDVKRRSAGASSDPWLNIFWLQQRPGEPSAAQAYANGRKAYLTEIKSRTAAATTLVDKYGGETVADNRPDFNEYPIWSPNCSSRTPGATPTMFLIHTQEGDGNADSLAKYLANPANQVSYHYTISKGATDDGVTVVDCVDTDMASWSVLDANVKSINLCFAGSYASWTRDQWLKQARAIDVAGYIIAQDCKKYGIKPIVVPPPYTAGTPGISDHMYVTKVLKIGSHTDVGPGFPWDVLAAAVAKYMGSATTPPVDTPAPFKYPPQDVMIREIWEQLRGPQAQGWKQLGGKSLVDAVADLRAAA